MSNGVFKRHQSWLLAAGLCVSFYSYYVFALEVGELTRHYGHVNGGLYFIMAFAPFTLSSLARPFGGIIAQRWQRKSIIYIWPYLLMAYGIINVLLTVIVMLINLPWVPWLLITVRVFEGLLIGGLVPQMMVYYYQTSSSLQLKVIASSVLFIILYFCMLLGFLAVNFSNEHMVFSINCVVSLWSIVLAWQALKYLQQAKSHLTPGLSEIQKLARHGFNPRNFWTIFRFMGFLTFMASLNSFFFSALPFFLIEYLNYPKNAVYQLEMIIIIFGISGFIAGGYLHNYIGKKWHITLGLVIKLILFFLFRDYIKHNLSWIVMLSSICIFCLGLMAAKVPLILNSVYAESYRLAELSITYNLTWGVMFGIVGYVSMYLIKSWHNLYIPSMIIMAFSYISILSLWFTPEEDFFKYQSIPQKSA